MMGFLRAMPLWLVLVLLLCGCEEDVTAVLGTDVPFTLYGYIDPEADTQFVRVFPVEGRLAPDNPAPLDARLTSTDLETNQSHTWHDSLLHFDDGTYGHLFWAAFRATEGHRYRLEAERSDGATSRATVTVPTLVEPVSQEPVVSGRRVTLPVRLEGIAPRILKPEVVYWARAAIPESERSITVSYEGKVQQVEGGWLINVELTEDFSAVRQALENANLLTCEPDVIILLDLTLRMMVVDEAWNPPGGVFDPEVLVQPGTMSNVENGFGFVGSGYRFETRWAPPYEAAAQAGFHPSNQGIPDCFTAPM